MPTKKSVRVLEVAAGRRNGEQQVGVALVEQLECLLLDVGESVEVAEDRRHRHTCPLRDVIGRRRSLAFQDVGERRSHDGLTAALTPGPPTVDRLRSVDRTCPCPLTTHIPHSSPP